MTSVEGPRSGARSDYAGDLHYRDAHTIPTNSIPFPSLNSHDTTPAYEVKGDSYASAPEVHFDKGHHHTKHSQGSVAFPSLEAKPPMGPGYDRAHQPHSSRPRGKSFTEQTQETVRQLAPPVSVPLVVLCLLWYMSSAVSNNLAKSILDRFSYPVTLTMAQFLYAMLFSSLAVIAAQKYPAFASQFPRGSLSTNGFVGPSKLVLESTGPMAAFQLFGHILSYSSMSQIPVSLVHAIKSLSPLFTVAASVGLFGMRYNIFTYASMIPLTLGVVMTCSAEFKARPVPLIYALIATMIFVAQNMFSKRLLTPGGGQRLDKMTILGWCAALAFVGTLPIWLVTDGWKFMTQGVKSEGSGILLFSLFCLNGLSHFCQNLLSFLVLGSISPVAFSIASLLKRIVVITVAILWFGQHVTSSQGWGILISFAGLYVYDRFGAKLETSLPR